LIVIGCPQRTRLNVEFVIRFQMVVPVWYWSGLKMFVSWVILVQN